MLYMFKLTQNNSLATFTGTKALLKVVTFDIQIKKISKMFIIVKKKTKHFNFCLSTCRLYDFNAAFY